MSNAFCLADNPKSDLKVGDTVVHNMNDGCKPLAEVVYIGSQHFEKVLSYQGEYLEIDKNQILICECRTLGCNGKFPAFNRRQYFSFQEIIFPAIWFVQLINSLG